MPQKTIYIRDEDVEFFDEAVKKLGNGRGIGSLIVGLLKEQMKKLDDETDEAMSLKMLEFCNPPPLLTRLIQHRLRSINEWSLMNGSAMAGIAFTVDPEYFTAEATTGALLGDESWFRHGNKLAEDGKVEYERQVTEAIRQVAMELSDGTTSYLEQLIDQNPDLAEDATSRIHAEMQKRAPRFARMMQQWPGINFNPTKKY